MYWHWVILGIPMGQCTIPKEPGWIELYNYFTKQVLLVPSGFHGFREEFKQEIVVVLTNLCKQYSGKILLGEVTSKFLSSSQTSLDQETWGSLARHSGRSP